MSDDDLTILDARLRAGFALANLFAWVRGAPLTGEERHELYQAGNRWRRAEKRARSRPRVFVDPMVALVERLEERITSKGERVEGNAELYRLGVTCALVGKEPEDWTDADVDAAVGRFLAEKEARRGKR